jgi:DNA-binding transcriptional LysR family regulator
VPRRFKVCASPAYIAQEGAPEHPSGLERRACLLFSASSSRTQWIFRRGNKPAFAVPVGGRLIVSHGLTMTVCAAEGLGPALLPDWLCRQELDEGTLVDLFPDYECTPTEFDTAAWLVHPSRNYVPSKVRTFVEFLQNEVHGFA